MRVREDGFPLSAKLPARRPRALASGHNRSRQSRSLSPPWSTPKSRPLGGPQSRRVPISTICLAPAALGSHLMPLREGVRSQLIVIANQSRFSACRRILQWVARKNERTASSASAILRAPHVGEFSDGNYRAFRRSKKEAAATRTSASPMGQGLDDCDRRSTAPARCRSDRLCR